MVRIVVGMVQYALCDSISYHVCLYFVLCRGAFGKVEQILQKHHTFLRKQDLPSIPTSTSPAMATANSMRSISSSIGEGSDGDDDLSTLNPIPENQTLGSVNRWGNGGSSQNTQSGELSSPPPQPARRRISSEMLDSPPTIVNRHDAYAPCANYNISPPKPPRRSSEKSEEESETGRTESLGELSSSQDHCPIVPRRLPEGIMG